MEAEAGSDIDECESDETFVEAEPGSDLEYERNKTLEAQEQEVYPDTCENFNVEGDENCGEVYGLDYRGHYLSVHDDDHVGTFDWAGMVMMVKIT